MSAALAGLIAAAVATSGSAQSERQLDYRAIWADGRTYQEFYDRALGRRSLWERNTANAEVPASLLDRARAVGGSWRLLAVSIDRCSDSVNTIPYVAALADAVAGLELRIIPPEGAGRAIMEAHRTPDDRAATPTVLLLNRDFEEAGAFIERPAELQAWYLDRRGKLSSNELFAGKMSWYDEDAGASTIEQVVAMLESAAGIGAP